MLFVRKKGLFNAFKSLSFLQYERINALIKGIPVELWMADSYNFVKRIRKDENAVIIFAKDDKLKKHFYSTQSIRTSIFQNGDASYFEL